MNSTDLEMMGNLIWIPFDKNAIKIAPDRWGTYVFRMVSGQHIGRLNGTSDILYIGSTENRSGLRKRLWQYLNPGPTQWTCIRVNELLKRYNVEVAWIETNDSRNMEHQLLQQYFKDHDELPPFNRAGRKQLKILLVEHIGIK